MPHLLVGFFLLAVKLEPSYDCTDARINNCDQEQRHNVFAPEGEKWI